MINLKLEIKRTIIRLSKEICQKRKLHMRKLKESLTRTRYSQKQLFEKNTKHREE